MANTRSVSLLPLSEPAVSIPYVMWSHTTFRLARGLQAILYTGFRATRVGVGREICLQSLSVSGLLHVLACKVTSKKALFRIVKVETAELGVSPLGSWTKLCSTPALDKLQLMTNWPVGFVPQCHATCAHKNVTQVGLSWQEWVDVTLWWVWKKKRLCP